MGDGRDEVAAVRRRVEALDWPGIEDRLDARGYACAPQLLNQPECRALASLYDAQALFRSKVVMERHAFGVGEYKYFAYPLPTIVQALRELIYPRLAPIANIWSERLRLNVEFPAGLNDFLRDCREQGQAKPTPLLLRYERDGYNCLHQDLYGEIAFPLQLAVVLSRPGTDFTGGELLLTEQRPRAQTRGEALTPEQGDAVIFANRYRPVKGARGFYRVNMRHGVSRIRCGRRFTLGIIFHDAR